MSVFPHVEEIHHFDSATYTPSNLIGRSVIIMPPIWPQRVRYIPLFDVLGTHSSFMCCV